MITYFLLIIISGFLWTITAPLTVLADATLPAGIASALTSIGFWFWIIESTIPYTLVALFAALVTTIGIETHVFSYKVVRWVYRKIPGIS